MPTSLRCSLLAAAWGLLTAVPAQAQLLLGPSFGVGVAVPVRNEGDRHDGGLHLGAALKLPILPLQIEGALDRMGAKDATDEDLTVWSAGAAIPFSLTPPLLPLSVYIVAGGGLYRHDAETTATDVGLSAGAGIRLGILLGIVAEGRGVLVLAEDDKLTWVTASLGLRF